MSYTRPRLLARTRLPTRYEGVESGNPRRKSRFVNQSTSESGQTATSASPGFV
ncbi:uncharacterized protein ANIA_11570 [Aspergillus nidulans FGSC A4]|uniref:Uncharacterized protein n=1 Tax=Emericella nidulans (strain FGSC A4 / ATCC 38163 / CBS 112.46 / NRRL 194 / M139) TaxID=227321 RepID=C8VBZ8_EMENI|nr:hypothetical protein [Aspergillus nidulans FGSC A4]CBF79815.1 TPA: hypothetical protein ANIA_11570 [Aspergillus nidulans FGSC A4]